MKLEDIVKDLRQLIANYDQVLLLAGTRREGFSKHVRIAPKIPKRRAEVVP
jgi:hypothetical protein